MDTITLPGSWAADVAGISAVAASSMGASSFAARRLGRFMALPLSGGARRSPARWPAGEGRQCSSVEYPYGAAHPHRSTAALRRSGHACVPADDARSPWLRILLVSGNPKGGDMHQSRGFTHLAKAASRFTGRPVCFGLALAVIAVWGISGPLFGFSDTWQLVINTGTTIIIFLMVFLIQNTQNRDTEAMQLKLDELIRATRGAHNRLMDLEEREEGELDQLRAQYEDIAKHSRHDGEKGRR